MSERNVKSHPPFGMRDKIGYMFGDLANDMTFMLQSSFLMVFYTQVLGIPAKDVGTLFLVSRIADAFTDTGMGRILDTVKPAKDGKFRPWIRRMAIPVALASFLMYQTSLAGAAMNVKMVYMYVTYLLWGSICYTAINIPYGSMASAITSDPDERTELSTYRTRGATIAQLATGFIIPLLIYTKVDGKQMVKTDATFMLVAAAFSILAIVFYAIHYFNTIERIEIKPAPKDPNKSAGQAIGSLLGNRALIGIIIAALCLIMAQLMIGTMNNYLFPFFYNSAAGISIVNLASPLLVLFVGTAVAPILAKSMGKKELATIVMFVASALYFIMYLFKFQNMYVYIVIATIAFLMFGMFNTVIWANITDVIDDLEVRNRRRDDGTVYGLYSFARKVGQAFAGAASGWALSGIGFVSGAPTQTPEVISGIYSISTIVPAISFLCAGLALMFIYPLTKKKVHENADILAARHAKKNA